MSLRKLTLTSSLIVLILLTLFPSYVKADIHLTSEFVDPVENPSFEYRNDSIPGDGVYGCPPWNSNNGGWRDLQGDVDNDGDVNYDDFMVVSGAYGSSYGQEGYDWRADFDGDGDVDYDDFVVVIADYGRTANRFDGAYSWYTGGGGDYEMWQWLDSDTLNAIRDRDVAFSYWFLPDFPSYSEIDTMEDSHVNLSYVLVSTLYIPTSYPTRVHLTKVQFDTYSYRTGKYWITYQRMGEDEVDIVKNVPFHNHEYETKEHACDVWGNKGEGIFVRFYTRCVINDYNAVFSKNYCVYYTLSSTAWAGVYWETGSTHDTVWCDYVEGNTSEWRPVVVVASIPLMVTAVQVIIHGKADFKAWIDQTSLRIAGVIRGLLAYDEEIADNEYGWFGEEIDGLTYITYQTVRALSRFPFQFIIEDSFEWDSNDTANLYEALFEVEEELGWNHGLRHNGVWIDVLIAWTGQDNDNVGGYAYVGHGVCINKIQHDWTDDNTVQEEVTHLFGDKTHCTEDCVMSTESIFYTWIWEDLRPIEERSAYISIWNVQAWGYISCKWCEAHYDELLASQGIIYLGTSEILQEPEANPCNDPPESKEEMNPTHPEAPYLIAIGVSGVAILVVLGKYAKHRKKRNRSLKTGLERH